MREVADLAPEGAQPCLFIIRAGTMRDDGGDVSAMIWLVANADLGNKPRKDSVLARKRDSSYSLQNGAFACRLITTDN